jgi:hypothetical protein
MRRAPVWLRVVAAYVALAALAAAIASLGGGGSKKPLTAAQKRATRANVGGPFPLELRSPQIVAGTSERVLVALGRPSLGALEARTPQSPVAQRAYVRSLHHEVEALMSALEAKRVHFGRPVLFARVWAGFAATIATKDLPAVQTLGLRVEPVGRFYPAQVAAKSAPTVRPLPTISKSQGPVAVLDAFPRRAHLRMDAVHVAGARHAPGERAGIRLAAVVHDELPHVRLERIRSAGSQPLENGRFDVFGTTDELIAGLERAVDPDQNGDTADAASVALTGLSAPFSGFPGSPASEAVDAAAALGTLVVAPAGDGGQANGGFGTVGAPGAAERALTVGALDASGEPAEASARGPTYALTPKPDLAIGGGAATRAGAAWGTAIAAARVAGVAAALRAERPALDPEQTAAALIGSAAARGESFETGGGDPLLQAARAAPYAAEPAQLVLRPGDSTSIRLTALGPRAIKASIHAPAGIRVTRAASASRFAVSAAADARAGSGRIELGPIAIPFTIVTAAPPAPPVGPLHLVHSGGRPDGVRFTLGRVARDHGAPTVVPVGNLILTLEGPGRRELTPPGGARDLLPSEYAYTLTGEVLGTLPPGRYRFVARAKGSAGGATVVRRSRSFRIG